MGSGSDTSVDNSNASGASDKTGTESDNVVMVGGSFEKDGLKGTVNDADTDFTDYDDPYGFYKPGDGKKYVKADFSFENNGKSDAYVSSADFSCYADNESCDQSFIASVNEFSGDTLSTGRKINFSVGTGIRLQETHLDYRKNTIDTILTRNLTRFTPSAFFRYRVSRNERFEIRYDGWSSDPSMTNRLALTDNSDPLNIHISNGNLKPAWNNRVRFEYNKYIVDRQQNYAVNASFNQSSNNIKHFG